MPSSPQSSSTDITPTTGPGTTATGTVALQVSQLIAQLHAPDADLAASARALLGQLVQEQPGNPVIQLGWGIALVLKGQLDAARTHFEKAIALDGKFGSAWSNLGNIHKLHGRFKQARECYDKAIAVQPDLADAHFNLAQVEEAEGDLQAAERSIRRALLFHPSYPEAHNNLGRLLINAGKVEQAVSHFRQALGANPGLRQARDNLIMSLYRLGRNTEAQSEVDQLLTAHPDDVHVLRVQAAGLAQQGRLDDAEAINRKLLTLQPDAPDLQWNLGEVMLQRDDYEGAMACYKEMLSKRNVPPALAIGAMANVMFVQGNYAEARDLYQQALGIDARHPRLLLGLARALLAIGETRQGLETLKHAITVLPNVADVHAQYLVAQRLAASIPDAERAAETARWIANHAPKPEPKADPEPEAEVAPLEHKRTEALRVGLVVADLENSAAGAALAVLLQQIDRDAMDLFVYQTTHAGPQARALQDQAAHWRPAATLGHADLAHQMQGDGLNLLIDLVGWAPGSRLQALALRPAPVQWSWLGDFSQPCAPLTDALLGDAALLGDTTGPCLPAALPWLPPSSCPEVDPLPALATNQPVLGVVAPLAHIQPETLDAWGQILQALPQARLRVLSDTARGDEATRQRLQRLLLLRDVEPERVDILPRLATDERWQELARMDLVLDTFPSPMAPTVALECLWMGVPVLTLQGTQPWQRTSTSVLAQVGLADWTTASVQAYVQQAVSALGTPQALTTLASLRASLRPRMAQAPCLQHGQWAQAFMALVRTLVPH